MEAGNAPVIAEGLWGSSAPIVSGLVAQRLHRPLLLVTAHADDAEAHRDDLETILGFPPEVLPQLDSSPSEQSSDREEAGERLRLCLRLIEYANGTAEARLNPTEPLNQPVELIEFELAAAAAPVIVAPLLALMQPVPAPRAITDSARRFTPGDTLDPEELVAWLESSGFRRSDQVEIPGDYARRGGIIDIYSNAHVDPVRLEFFDDELESLRAFDSGTQRSSRKLPAVQIPALTAATEATTSVAQRSDETTSFLALLPPNTILALDQIDEIQEIGRTYFQRLGERAGLITVEALLRRSQDFGAIHLAKFATGAHADAVTFDVQSLPQFDVKSSDNLAGVRELSARGDVVVLCENSAEQQRFDERLTELDESIDGAHSALGTLHHGFRWGDIAYVAHHEVYGRPRQRRTMRRVTAARPIDSFLDLQPNDYVVHVLHGIGRFLGLKTIEREGRQEEFLAVGFAEDAVMHVPVSQIHVVQKYIGSFRGAPKLSKLGGNTWKRTKQRVADAVGDLAAELLAVQAQREAAEGVNYPYDTLWQREFEDAFPYQETEDQLRALAEIKQDQTRPRAMDRLICGDVGFGKTELAIRAAFKTVEFGKQVAVLVPTTVLAEQHYQTFSARMADFPFRVEVISRFRSKAEQSKIVEKANTHQLDILIGTHRLLSKDVKFADLGLIIIDEEQRFGVEAKEKLKNLRAMVDVLTLSATPIPRTLHMSLLGIRDISTLQTPPLDRRAIVTQVRQWRDDLLRDAIYRELNRDGQVYFVHNFVRDIYTMAGKISEICPDARVVVGHGKMSGPELEDVMLKFMRREADVLVSTNIIESGLDIPAANTIFVHRPERFGLADLHQLRGRVGRGDRRAYCYLLLSPKHPVTDVSARRLKAIEHYSDLGAGFQIAMRDLELRGAGNILGPEQSGHIEAVGYEMYCQLLEQAVRKLSDQPQLRLVPVSLDLGTSPSIPRRYIRAERQRMDIYKRLSLSQTVGDIDGLRSDLVDAYGPVPEEVETLLQLAEIRVLASGWGVRAIVLKPPDVIFSVDELKRAEPIFSGPVGSPRMPDPQTIHWRLPPAYLELQTLLNVLRKRLADPPVLQRA